MNQEMFVLKEELKKVLSELLNYLESESFIGDEREVSRIELFVDNKQVYYEKIEVIDTKMKSLGFSKAEVKKIRKEYEVTLKRIVAIEEENKRIFDKLSQELLTNIKNLKKQQQFTSGYYTSLTSSSGLGGRFDTKQ